MKKILIFSFCVFSLIGHADSCVQFLTVNYLDKVHDKSMDPSDNLIAYLSILINENVLTLKDFKKLIMELQENKIITNPLNARITTEQSIHHPVLQEYLDTNQFDKKTVLNWASDLIKQKEKANKARRAEEEKTKDSRSRIVFYTVKGGSFITGRARYSELFKDQAKSAIIPYDFEMMSTSITQHMWKELMGELPMTLPKVGNDFPVTNITWWSAATFANELSKKRDLNPAYDFSGIDFRGKASDGTLAPVDHWKAYDIITERSLDTVAVESNGYRLPTDIEQEFVSSDRGRSRTAYFSGVEEKNLERYSWNQKNSNFTIHPVADLEPLVIDDTAFFDLYGNIWEMNSSFQPALNGARIRSFSVHGGDWMAMAHAPPMDGLNNMAAHYFQSCGRESKDIQTGFRLVRTKK